MNDCKNFYWGVWPKYGDMFQIWLKLTKLMKIYMDFYTHLLHNLSIACESEHILDRKYSQN